MNLWTIDGTTVRNAAGVVVGEFATVQEALTLQSSLMNHVVRQYAAMINGDDAKPSDLASSVDACLDAAASQIMANDVTALPGWAQQVVSLTIAAGVAIDQLLIAMGIPDPDATGSDD